MYQSHETYHTIPKGAKYIYVVRNPLHVCLSMYTFFLAFTQVIIITSIIYALVPLPSVIC